MTKGSRRHPRRYENDQAGCIWGFIGIFDFRRGQSTRRLLSERKHSSRQVVGAGYSRSKLHMPADSNGDSQEISDGEERDTLMDDDAKMSVKELMEEEMFSEQDQKKQVTSADIEAKELDSKCVKKNHKRMGKTSKSSCDIHCEVDAAENLGLEISCNQDSFEKTLKNLDMEVVMNKLCQKIYPKSASMKHDWNGGLDTKSEAYSESDKKLFEAIKVFVDQRLTEEKHPMEDEKIEHSKEFVGALQTLSSNKDLILELLKDPNPLFMKHIENLEDVLLEKDQNSNSLARANLLDGKLRNSKPSEPAARRKHSFFRRKSKSQEKIFFKGNENCQTSNRIVILKPGLASVHTSESEAKFSSSWQSHHSLGTKVPTERTTSQFSFIEIKRKLKHAMGKEWHGIPSDDISHRVHSDHQNSHSDKVIGGEKGGWNSPNRNHFYIARLAIGIKNKHKSCKPKDTETSMGNKTVEYPEQRLCNNIYIEAKKHLSEMLTDADEIEEISSRQPPTTLGRILSLPEFNFSPICSPRRDNEHSFVTALERLSPCNNFAAVNEDSWQLTQENYFSQSFFTDQPEDTEQSCTSNSDVLDEFNRAEATKETLCSVKPEKSSEGDVEIVETTDSSVNEESDVLDISAEQCSSAVIRDDQNRDLTEVCDEDEYAQCLKLDQLLSSPLTSPPSCSITKHVGYLDSAHEIPDKPSPVSVLEPLLFTENDISPASIKSKPAKPPTQPQQIHFEERPSCATNQEIFVRACMEDEESAFEYVEAVLLASDLNWEEFLLRWLSSNQLLDASLFDEVELFSNRSCQDQKLLFGCTNEVLKEVCERYFGYSPWVSSLKHNIRPIPKGKELIHEVWEEVEWHLLPQPYPHTLDQIVRKDLSTTGTWMDIRSDVESIGIEIGEAIFEELVEDDVLRFVNEGPDTDSPLLPEEMIENE